MNDVKAFTESTGFIIFFLVVLLAIVMLAGDKAAVWFLWLVLLGMMITNSEKISNLLGRVSHA